MHLKIKEIYKKKETTKGITLIALVITIIVLLILVRNININANGSEWDFTSSNKGKRRN